MIRKDRLALATLDWSTLVLAMAAGLIAAGVLKDLLLLAAGRDREIANLVAFLTLRSNTDSWAPMYAAVDLFRSEPDAGLYQTIFFDRQTKFQYPPTSLLPILGLSLLGIGGETGIALLQLLSFAAVIGIVVVTALIYRELRDLPGLSVFSARPGADWLVLAGLAAGALTFDPIMYAYEVGQIQVLIDLAAAAALLLALRRRMGWAGAAMALAALVKPQYGLVLVWSLLRREHAFTKGFLAVGVPAGLLSLAVFGLDEHLSYLSVVSYIGRHGEVFWANQSVNGLLNRLFVDADAMTWEPNAFAPFHPLVYGGTLLSTVAFIAFGLWFWPRWRRDAASGEAARIETALDFATMVTALTLASPIAWEHHYGVTWPMMVAALVVLLDLRARGGGRRIDALLVGLGASYWLTSNYLTQLFPLRDAPLNVLQSYGLFGGLALLVVLAGARAAAKPLQAA